MDEPCNWPEGDCPTPEGVTNDQMTAATEEAIWILWVLTGQRFGQCEITIASPPVCLCSFACTCGKCYIHIPAPAGAVSLITENGVTVTDWTQQGNRIWRPFGWLHPNDLEITYLRGYPVPPGGARAVGTLATQIALAACGSSKCELPPDWESRTRRGDTVRRQAANGQPQSTLTGLPTVDRWVTTARKYGRQGRVWTPDVDGWIMQAGPTVPA